MIRLLIVLSFCSCAFAEEWSPISEFADTDGKQIRITSSNNPRYTFDDSGSLVAIDPFQEELEWVGDKQYYRRKAMPISAGLLKYATHEGLEWLSSARDFGTDRGIQWTLWDVEWGGVHSLPDVDSPKASKRVNKQVQEAGDYHIFNNFTTVRRAVAIPSILNSTNFSITYRLQLHDLRVANAIDSASNFIPDTTTGCFVVTTNGGQGRFIIRQPKLLDADWNVIPIPSGLCHRLRIIDANTLEYVKYPGSELLIEQLKEATYVDAETTLYGMANDGQVYKNDANWSVCRGAATGTGANNAATDDNNAIAARYGYYVNRGFFQFDTTFLTAAYSGTLGIYPNSTGTAQVAFYRGRQSDSLSASDYSSFGDTGGKGEYLEVKTWSNSAYNYFTVPSSLVVPGGYTKFAFLNYYCDVLGNTPPYGDTTTYLSGVCFSESTGSSHDPILILNIISSANSGSTYYLMNN